eukprot:6192356-Pleurochrysis_carterae.AAC.1
MTIGFVERDIEQTMYLYLIPVLVFGVQTKIMCGILCEISLGPSGIFRVNVLPHRPRTVLASTHATLRTSSSGSAAARCQTEPRIDSAVACEVLLSNPDTQSSYKALEPDFFQFAGSVEQILDSAAMSQAEKTAKNCAKLPQPYEGPDVPVDYLSFLMHNMRAMLVRFKNSNEHSRARSLLLKWYDNEDAPTKRRQKVLRLMQRDWQERQGRLTVANTVASSSLAQALGEELSRFFVYEELCCTFFGLVFQDVNGQVDDVRVARGTASGDAVPLPAALCKTMQVAPTPDIPVVPASDATVSGTYDSASDDYDESDDDGLVLEVAPAVTRT